MNIKKIKDKRKHLEQAKRNLKNHFIGLDNIIDNIFANIEIWYIMPELLTRPIVVNLWGMTGVGKTDLIRRLIRELNFEKSYVEIQLDSGKSSAYSGHYTIKQHIKSNNINPEDQGIVFLDEIQRFRTIDEQGNLINNNDKYQDIWMLLSDGQFSDYGNQKKELEMLLLETIYSKDCYQANDDENEVTEGKESSSDKPSSDKPPRLFKSSVWSAQNFKTELEIDISIEKIMKMSIDEKILLIHDRINNLHLNKNVRQYSKLLIFISGNLDEAYDMAEGVSEVSVDADILYEFSKKINVLDIKKSLLQKFKPEQIARFGNIHIIYPSLNRKNFENLIEKKLSEITKRTFDQFNIKVSFDKNIHMAIYRNGVYPTQGVRPVFSTISSMIENLLPTFLFFALSENGKNISLQLEDGATEIKAKIGNNYISKEVKMDMDIISKDKTKDQLSLVGAHESGHAVVYSLLYRLAPSQIVSDATDYSRDGFMIPHQATLSKNILLNQIQVLLAGTVAEEIVFGEQNKTTGNSNDIVNATRIATSIIRQYNMDGSIGTTTVPTAQNADSCLVNIEDTNSKAEQILEEQKSKAKDLIQDNLKLFKEVYLEVLKKKRLFPEEFYKVAKKYIPDIQIKSSDYVKTYNYHEISKKFLNQKREGA